jgi:hypothetical protein
LPNNFASDFGVVYFFSELEDNGAASLTHHLPVDNVGNCVLASATASGCKLVEAKSTSSTGPNMEKFVALPLPPSPYIRLVSRQILTRKNLLSQETLTKKLLY